MKAKFRDMVDDTYAQIIRKEADKGNPAAREFLQGDPLYLSREELQNIKRSAKYKCHFQNNRMPCYYCGKRYDSEYLDKTYNDQCKEVDICIRCQRAIVEGMGD